MVKSSCEYCGVSLSDSQMKKKNRCCSHSCSNALRYINVPKTGVCQACGKTYKRRSRGKEGLKYCSVVCAISVNAKRPKTEEHKRKIAEAQKSVRVEGEFICGRCGRIFESNTSCRAHKASCGHIREKMRCVKCGRDFVGLAGLIAHQRDCYGTTEWKQKRNRKFSDMAIKRCQLGIAKKSTGTSIEVLFESGLKKEGVVYEKQFIISGERHCFDFYLPVYNLLVEVDGDWWHGNTKKHGELSGWQKRQWYIDQNNVRLAKENGFRVIRFWGSDLIGFWEDCVKEAIEYGKGRESGVSRCREGF